MKKIDFIHEYYVESKDCLTEKPLFKNAHAFFDLQKGYGLVKFVIEVDNKSFKISLKKPLRNGLFFNQWFFTYNRFNHKVKLDPLTDEDLRIFLNVTKAIVDKYNLPVSYKRFFEILPNQAKIFSKIVQISNLLEKLNINENSNPKYQKMAFELKEEKSRLCQKLQNENFCLIKMKRARDAFIRQQKLEEKKSLDLVK